ncbi:Acyl-coenzyme A thioesterase 9, mitochondrial [Smittium mucronatum]|uniref:Acyl-coenzyme A thioesterase 9, mitochondrial n=1 Tax=Smittium mucronatum TaxID=133383 RepID=A0A1R0H0L1_9FUNG|nr:Acyl-coenzyme A thioesterase 9, mitochondrial [Smittium mucronatum]
MLRAFFGRGFIVRGPINHTTKSLRFLSTEFKDTISKSDNSTKQNIPDFKSEMEHWEKMLKRYPVLPSETSSDISYYKKFDTLPESFETTNSKDQLVLKTISDSYCELWLPFRDAPSLLNQYVNQQGEIRVGKILEDLDRLAGAIAYKHTSDIDGQIKNLVIVTAAVDRIDIHEYLDSDCIYKASGHVVHVGYSSIDISLVLNKVLSTEEGSSEKPCLTARFTMVARNRDTGKAEQINPLMLSSEKERIAFKTSELIKREKSLLNKKGLEKTPPNFVENNDYNSSSMNKDFVWLDDTTMSSVHVCFPSERNIHHKVFGGFLMRVGHELAYANACMYSGANPISKSLDDFSFTKPVNVGSILRLTSQVIYSSDLDSTEQSHDDKHFQVSVKVDVLDPTKQTIETTNTFYFTFESNSPVRRVIPRTYDDMIKYIEGRRRSQIGSFISNAQQI